MTTDNTHEALAEEHVIDREGMVWRIVRDGGMATRAHQTGIVSIGIATLERESGPLVTLAAHVAAVEERARTEALRKAAETLPTHGVWNLGVPASRAMCRKWLLDAAGSAQVQGDSQ